MIKVNGVWVEPFIILDSWVLCKGDGETAPSIVRQFRQTFADVKGLQVRTIQKRVRALGSSTPVTVVVARRRNPNAVVTK